MQIQYKETAPNSTSHLVWDTPLQQKSKQVRPGRDETETCVLKMRAFLKYGETAATNWTELLSSSVDTICDVHLTLCPDSLALAISLCCACVYLIINLNYVNTCLGWINPMRLYCWGVHANCVFFSFFLCFFTSVLLKPEMSILSNLYLDFMGCAGWAVTELEFAETNGDV